MRNTFESGNKGETPLNDAEKLAFRKQKRNYVTEAASGGLSANEMSAIPGMASSGEITTMPGRLPNSTEVQGAKAGFRSAKRMYVEEGPETAFGVDVKGGKRNQSSPDDEITEMPGLDRRTG